MNRADLLMWRAAAIVALALAFICFWQLARAMDGAHVEHVLGWAEGFPCALAAAYSCRAALDLEGA